MGLAVEFGIYGKGKETGDYLRCMLGRQYMYSSSKELTYYYTKQALSLEETMPRPQDATGGVVFISYCNYHDFLKY